MPGEARHGARHACAVRAGAREGVPAAGRRRGCRAPRRLLLMATGTLVDVVMPQMGVSVSEGTVTKWLKSEGEAVEADETLLEISTDKVDTEVPSPASGVVQQILAQEGETVDVGTKIAVIAPEARQLRRRRPRRRRPPRGEFPSRRPRRRRRRPRPRPAPRARRRRRPRSRRRRPRPPLRRTGRPTEHASSRRWWPDRSRARRRRRRSSRHWSRGARDQEGHPRLHRGRSSRNRPRSGRGADRGPETPTPTPTPAPAPATPAPAPPPRRANRSRPCRPCAAGSPSTCAGRSTPPHVTSAIEVDMSKVAAIRQKLKDYQDAYGVNPTYLAFVARAAVETLKDYPGSTASCAATRSSRELRQPGVRCRAGRRQGPDRPRREERRDAEPARDGQGDRRHRRPRAREKSFSPRTFRAAPSRSRTRAATAPFTAPVISQPQAGIGTYAVVKRPWVVQDEMGEDVIAIRSIMNLTLTYDHRLVDGALAGRFLRDMREQLQTRGESDY